MKNYIKNLILPFGFLFTLVVVCTPFVTYAGGIVPCGFGGKECTVCDLQVLAGNLLNFLVFFSVFVAALLFLNAGILYITSSTNVANIAKAHRLFTSALIGFLIILSSWLIINTVMSFMYSGAWGDWSAIFDSGKCEEITVTLQPSSPPIEVGTGKEAEIRELLASHDISVNNPAPTTEVGGLKPHTIEGIIALNNELNLDRPLVITGGSESGYHTEGATSHANGYKIDLGKNSNQTLDFATMQKVLPTAIKRDRTLKSGTVVTDFGYEGTVNGRKVQAYFEYSTGAGHWDIIFHPD